MKVLLIFFLIGFNLIGIIACNKKSSNQNPNKISDLPQDSLKKNSVPANTELDTINSTSQKQTEVKNNGLGFYSVADLELPEKIKKSSNSIFQLKVLGNEASQYFNLETDLERLKKLISDEKNANSMDKIVINKMIEYCLESEDLKLKQNCPIVFSIHSSTGFTTNNGTTLWTASHSIEPFLKLRSQDGKLPAAKQLEALMPIAVFVFNQNGDLVINPIKEKIRPLNIPILTRSGSSRNSFYAEDSDYISLSLPRKISDGLVFSSAPPTINDPVYLLGYAVCTGCNSDSFVTDDIEAFQDRSPAPNSDGNGLKFSKGKVLDKKLFMPEIYELDQNAQPIWGHENILAYSADSNHGMSGGPVLNSSGEIIAIHRGGFFKKNTLEKLRISNGFSTTRSDLFK